MIKLNTVATAMALVLACAGVAKAEEAKTAPPAYGAFTGTIGFVNDYRFRGITQSGERPAIQGSIDWSHNSGLYAGVWGSSIDFNDGNQAEVETDVYGGYKFAFSGLNFDVGVIGYLYPGANSSLNYDYWEGKVAASYDFGMAAVNAGLNYSPDYFGGSGDALFSSVGLTVPIMKTGVSFVGTYGYQAIDNNARFAGIPDYGTWTAGLTYSWNNFTFAASYLDTSIGRSHCADGCDATGIVSVSRTF
jgi:uncharacterized protein (TIGR02001 family)